jgi:hypothetical protein
MSNVIQFLETLGKGPILSSGQYAAAVAALDVNDSQREALLARDERTLSEMLGGRKKMMCLVVLPEEALQGESEQVH